MAAGPQKHDKVDPALDKVKAGSDSSVQNPLHTDYHKDVAEQPKKVAEKLLAADGKTDVVQVTNEKGEKVNAVQVMHADGPRLKAPDGSEYKLKEEGSGKQVWVSTDGKSTYTQERTDDRNTRNNNTGSDTTTNSGGTGGNEKNTVKNNDSTTGTSGGSGTEKELAKAGGGQGSTTDVPAGTVPDKNVGKNEATIQPVNPTEGNLKTQPVEGDKHYGGRNDDNRGKNDSGETGRGIGKSDGGEGGRGTGKSEGGEEGRGLEKSKGGSDEGRGSDKVDKGEGKISIPEKSIEKPSEKPTEKSPDKPTDKPVEKPSEKPEAGNERGLDKIDLSKQEGRRELFEALKSMRDVLDGKTDLKSIDPGKRALVEDLMKLDQKTTDKLFGLLSNEFKGKDVGMSDAAYAFNLRTLMGLEKLAGPTQPPPPIPGLSPELTKGLYDLLKMYTDGQNAQRSTVLAEAYKFSVDYNNSLGLDKNGLTSRDVLVALNTMSKDFGDLVSKQNPALAALMASKETQAQLLGKDAREATGLTAEQARQGEKAGAALADQMTAAQARAAEAALKVPQGTQGQDALGVGKVEGQIVKDAGAARLDALTAHQQAAEQAATAKTQPNQFGQKDPLTAEQKELADRDQGTKKRLEEDKDRDKDEIARRMAMEAAIAAAGGARATSAEITEGNDEGDKDEKKQDEKEARRNYKTKQGDTLEMIAETQLKSKTAATLIYNINKDRIPAKVMGNLYIISMKSDMALDLPTPNEVKTFKGPYLQFQYREFGSAEEELAFWQKFITGQEPGHSSLFDKFGLGQGGGSAGGVGVDDSFAAEAFTAAQRQSIRTQLGMENKEAANQTTKTVRYGESIRKFAARTVFDEALWELIARKNALPVVEDTKGEKTVRLKSYQKLILPTAAEIKEFKQSKTGFTTQQSFEMVSQECPKCRRLVRQNESVCPPPCFYAFAETGVADGKPAEPAAEVKDEVAARMLRRRRTTGFVPPSESKPEEVPDQPFENEVISTVLKAAGLSSAAKVEAPQLISKMPIPASGGVASNPSKRGIKVSEFDSVCRVVLTPKDREGNKFERRLEVRKDDAWVPCVVYEIGQQESFVTEYDPTGAPRKQRIDLPFEPALELSENHINEAWKEYKQQFLGE